MHVKQWGSRMQRAHRFASLCFGKLPHSKLTVDTSVCKQKQSSREKCAGEDKLSEHQHMAWRA
eukprot:9889187-Heterocapsa_arctica.AAC.1